MNMTGHHATMMMGMQMTFYDGYNVTVLFPWWKTSDWGTYIPTLLAVFFLSFIAEAMQKVRCDMDCEPQPSVRYKFKRVALATGLTALFYLHMLIAMTYNTGLFAALCLGAIVGFFFFRSKQMTMDELKCH